MIANPAFAGRGWAAWVPGTVAVVALLAIVILVRSNRVRAAVVAAVMVPILAFLIL